MRTLAAALAAALVAGITVYVWRSAELADRQDRLLDAVVDQTRAEIQADRLQTELQELRAIVRQLRAEADELERELGDEEFEIAPALSTEPDGRYFGYLKSLDLNSNPPVLVIDFAEFLTGEAAQSAAEDAGVTEPGEPVPNDYFIRNVNPKLRTLEIDEKQVRVVLATWDRHNIPDPKRVKLVTLARIFNQPKAWEMNVTHNGYWLTIDDGRIVRLEEQYVP